MVVTVGVGGIGLEAVEDLGRLHVESPLGPSAIDVALKSRGLGRVDGDGVLLDVRALEARAASLATSADWTARWTRMLEVASSKGWTSADGRAVRAHIVTVATSGGASAGPSAD